MPGHSPLSDALLFSERRPHRSLLILSQTAIFTRLVENYHLIIGFTVTFILLVQALPYAPVWTTLWIGLFWFYHFAKGRIREEWLPWLTFRMQEVQIGRAFLLIAAITIFLGHLYLNTNYLRQAGSVDSLWLLYLLAIFIISQYGSTAWMLWAVFAASASLLAINILEAQFVVPLPFPAVVARPMWLALLAIILHTLVRFISERTANLQLVYNMQKELMEFQWTGEERELLATVVNRIRQDFGYAHVNIFLVQPGGVLRCAAGASPGGGKLADSNFEMPAGLGIIGQVVKTGEPHKANRTQSDPNYVRHDEFPETKSELCVPITGTNRILGVLDVQDHREDFFVPYDEEVLEMLAHHVGKVLDNFRLMKSMEQIGHIAAAIASRFLAQHELQATLQSIADAARDELDADLVVLYQRNPRTKQVLLGAYAGDLLDEPHFNTTLNSTYSLVYRLVGATADRYFHTSVGESRSDPLFAPTPDDDRRYPEFAQREKVVSRAIFRLKVGEDCLGMMFLNFRRLNEFDLEDRNKYSIFVTLATLAIEMAQAQQKRIQFERESLVRQLHDELMAGAFIVSLLVAKVLRDPELADTHREKLEFVRSTCRDMSGSMRFLHDMWKDIPMDSLEAEISVIADRATQVFGVRVNQEIHIREDLVPQAMIAQLRLIASEAVMNAVRHGNASRIDIEIDDGQEALRMLIRDNGLGFDMDLVQPRGLDHMRNRASQIGGTCTIHSALGKGTELCVDAPYCKEVINHGR